MLVMTMCLALLDGNEVNREQQKVALGPDSHFSKENVEAAYC